MSTLTCPGRNLCRCTTASYDLSPNLLVHLLEFLYDFVSHIVEDSHRAPSIAIQEHIATAMPMIKGLQRSKVNAGRASVVP